MKQETIGSPASPVDPSTPPPKTDEEILARAAEILARLRAAFEELAK